MRIPVPYVGAGSTPKRSEAADQKLAPPFDPGEGEAPTAPAEPEPEARGVEVGSGPDWAAALPSEPPAGADVAAEGELVADAEVAERTEEETSLDSIGEAPAQRADVEPEAAAAGSIEAWAPVETEGPAPWGESAEPTEPPPARSDEHDEGEERPRFTPLEAAAEIWGEDTGQLEPPVTAKTAEETLAADAPSADSPSPPTPVVEAGAAAPQPRRLGPGPLGEPRVEPPAPPVPAPTAGVEIPEFLFGPDATPEEAEEETAEPADELSSLAARLLEGSHGDAIRELIESMRGAARDLAITRAFAAGYRAAREGQEE